MRKKQTDLNASVILDALCSSGQAVYCRSRRDDSMTWSDGANAVLGVAAESLAATGADFDVFLGRASANEYDNGRADAPAPGAARVRCYHILGAKGPRWLEERLAVREGGAGKPLVGVLTDVTERKREEMRLARLAAYDPLTSLLNRTQLRENLAQAIARAVRHNTGVAYIAISVDNLQGINAAYGYDVADEVIAKIGGRLNACLRNTDQIGRIAGAKFGAVLTQCDHASAMETAARLRDAVRTEVIDTRAGAVSATASLAVVLMPHHARAAHKALSLGQEALDQAKLNGPDSISLYDPSRARTKMRQRNAFIADQVVSALDENRLILAYQPIVRTDDPLTPAFHECLVRMRDRNGALISAGEFMPVAEKLGLVRLLDQRVMEMALNTLRAAPLVRLSINLSAQSVDNELWLRSFFDMAADATDVVERLVIEITESTAIRDAEKAASFVEQMRSLGCAFALDDFGAGYTSFRHLRRLKFDMVKIDGSFVRGLGENSDNRMFVRTLTEIARNFDMLTVAEYVSNDEEAEILRKMGVDCLQGFHFGAPQIAPAWLTAANVAAMIA